MSRDALEALDHEMHRLRNRALHRVLTSILRCAHATSQVRRARMLARRSRRSPWDRTPDAPPVSSRPRRTHLRLVRGRCP
jgi:hypothetical protein